MRNKLRDKRIRKFSRQDKMNKKNRRNLWKNKYINILMLILLIMYDI